YTVLTKYPCTNAESYQGLSYGLPVCANRCFCSFAAYTFYGCSRSERRDMGKTADGGGVGVAFIFSFEFKKPVQAIELDKKRNRIWHRNDHPDIVFLDGR